MTPRQKKLILAGCVLGALGGLALVALFSTVVVVAPHMIHQPHLRAYEAVMPLPPEGSVPVEAQPFAFPPDATDEANPVEGTPADLARGAVYYGYYCLQCHGEDGAGHGPVGESYMPVPADLTTPRIQNQSDGQLRRAMLTGPGHAPVLSNVVPDAHRWYVVAYLRSLAEPKQPPANRNP